MTPNMVANFRRSLSFQNHASPSNTSTSKLPRKNFHVRSTSLPCRSSYPLNISHLKDPIHDLKNAWSSSKASTITSANLIDGLSRLKTIHQTLDDLLQLQHTRESLRQNPDWVEKVLDDLLGLIDIYGMFRSLVLALKQEVSAARLAMRRSTDHDLKSRLYNTKALKKTAKETVKLVSATRSIGRRQAPVDMPAGSDVNSEVCELIREVMEVTVLVSGSLFGGISSSFSTRKASWLRLKYAKKTRAARVVVEGIQEFQLGGMGGRLWGLSRKEKDEDEEVKRVVVLKKKMAEMEECMNRIEGGSEKMFRSLISTRVSLLNVLTQ